MNEKELANKIYNELIHDSKYNDFEAEVIKPQSDSNYDGYNFETLKLEAKKLGFNVFRKEEINADYLKHEKGETILATFYNINDLL